MYLLSDYVDSLAGANRTHTRTGPPVAMRCRWENPLFSMRDWAFKLGKNGKKTKTRENEIFWHWQTVSSTVMMPSTGFQSSFPRLIFPCFVFDSSIKIQSFRREFFLHRLSKSVVVSKCMIQSRLVFKRCYGQADRNFMLLFKLQVDVIFDLSYTTY